MAGCLTSPPPAPPMRQFPFLPLYDTLPHYQFQSTSSAKFHGAEWEKCCIVSEEILMSSSAVSSTSSATGVVTSSPVVLDLSFCCSKIAARCEGESLC